MVFSQWSTFFALMYRSPQGPPRVASSTADAVMPCFLVDSSTGLWMLRRPLSLRGYGNALPYAVPARLSVPACRNSGSRSKRRLKISDKIEAIRRDIVGHVSADLFLSVK